MYLARSRWLPLFFVSFWAALVMSCDGQSHALFFNDIDAGAGGAGGQAGDDEGSDSGSLGCATDDDCDDGLSCTIDTCTNGECAHVPGPSSGPTACPAGQYCESGKGCVQGIPCADDARCEAELGDDICTTNIHCDTTLALCRFSLLDKDGDGHAPLVCGGDDCNDADPTIHAGHPEICDGKDNDCNGLIDDGATCPGLEICQGGQCVCPPANRCGSECVDKSQNVAHCGACNHACPFGVSCSEGRCLCPGAQTVCSGACVDTSSDVNHCGACNAACPPVANGARVCSMKSCVVASCSPGYADCNQQYGDGCETYLQSDDKNCGSCGNVCAANQSCVGGACQLKSVRVLLVHTEGASQATDVQTKLQGTGAFSLVDSFYAGSDTPTVAKLQQYDSVLVWSNYNFGNTNLLGDNLATYFDGGGQVVVAVFANGGVQTGLLGGRFGNPAHGYILLAPADKDIDAASLGTVHEPGSPLMAGVSSLSATTAYRGQGQVVNGGVVVARWDGTGSRPLIIRGVVKGRNRVDLNMWPVSSAGSSNGWTGHGATILKNALLYR